MAAIIAKREMIWKDFMVQGVIFYDRGVRGIVKQAMVIRYEVRDGLHLFGFGGIVSG